MNDFRDIDVQEALASVENNEIIDASDGMERIRAWRDRRVEGIKMPWSKLSGLFEIYPGQLVLLGGYSGHFKTTISTHIAYAAMQQGHKVGIASLELEFAELMTQWLSIAAVTDNPPDAWSENALAWAKNKLFVYDRTDAITPEEAIQMIIAFHRFRGCSLVILDALMMTGVCQDTEREQQFSQTVASVAKRFGISVLLIHHMRKPMGQDGESKVPGKYDFIGSSHLVNIAHSVLVGWHDKKKHYELMTTGRADDERPDYLLTVAKQRSAPFEGAVGLWRHPKARAFCSTKGRLLKPLDFDDGNTISRNVA